MIEYFEIPGPTWAEKTFQLLLDEREAMKVGLRQMNLISKEIYIGVDEVDANVMSLRRIKRYMEAFFSGYTLTCWTTKDRQNVRLARLFGFTKTQEQDDYILYERKL